MHAADMVGFNKFLPYMPDVDQCARSLVELNTTWRMLESFARLQGNAGTAMILPTLAAARSGFNALEQDLVKSLVAEKLATAMAVPMNQLSQLARAMKAAQQSQPAAVPAAVAELDWTPNASARSLRTRRTGLVGIGVAELRRP